MATATDHVDRLFRALASAPRREILRLLASEDATCSDGGTGCDSGNGNESAIGVNCCSPHDVCACTFADQLGLGAPTVSHHMRVLKEAGLVTGEKRGLWVYYRLCPDALEEVCRLIASFRIAEES